LIANIRLDISIGLSHLTLTFKYGNGGAQS